MLKLVAWLVVMYAIYQIWNGVRMRRRNRFEVRDSGQVRNGRSAIDRSKVVDAEFTEVDDREDEDD